MIPQRNLSLLFPIRGALRQKEPRDRRLWTTRLSAQVAILPDFDRVFRAVRRALREVGAT